ncbi:pilus (MSHA type) biogenesis protein MshL [Marinimicrobium sp. LS-A18]|uniref:pilus (MSHA type) biogenesis protein MshL n=1 Tax=Marinimicrobium sp. LS-A18 TaxID=1381596 RepID=UPI0004AF8934|nr:pilus (MSHA type) biogenesis protein MshL [Marinimicrobium sp. LS-A18]
MDPHFLRRTMHTAAALMAVVLVTACVGPRDSQLAAEREMSEVAEAQREQAQAVPEEVSQALVPERRRSEEVAPERFDVRVRNVPAKAFFLGLVQDSDTNIVVHPDVSGSLSLELKGVTVDEVLEVARDIYGYDYRRSGNIYTVYPNELQTQVFHVNYLDVQRVGVSDTNLSIGRSESSNNNRNNRGSGNNSGSGDDSANLLGLLAGEDGSSTNGSEVSPGARVQTMNRTDFWQSLRQSVSAIVGGEGGDKMVMVSPQAGMVVVKAMPHELNAVREFLERSELSVRRQVILEAKILEVRLNEGFQAGINWGAISGQLDYGYNRLRSTSYSEQDSAVRNIPGTSSRQVAGLEELQRGTENLFTSVLQVGDVTDLLDLLETQGSVQVLSSPRVSTVNNQKALIRVGSDEYFVTGISNNTTSNVASVTSTPNIELSSFFSGIALDVTPQIADSGEVILHIHPVVSEVNDQLKVFTVGSEEFALPLAQRGIRESDSIVRARSGQVVVLGGLMQEDTRDTDGKRPVLGDIPLLNSLFKTQGRSRQKTELVILLRPVVVDDGTWQDELDRSRNRMQQMGDGYRDLWEQ